MEGNNSTDFPVANHLVENGVHVATKPLPFANWKLVGDIAGEDVLLIKEARSPVGTRVIDILPPRLASGAGRLRATPAGTEVTRRIAPAFRPCIGDLSLQSILHSLLQYRLECVVTLIGIGPVGSGDAARQI